MNLVAAVEGAVDGLAGLGVDEYLFRIHLVFGKVLHIDITEVSQTGVHGDEGEVDSLDFHPLHQLTAEMESGGRYGHRSFVLGEDGLETLLVLRLGRTMDEGRQRGFAQCVQRFLELIVRTV